MTKTTKSKVKKHPEDEVLGIRTAIDDNIEINNLRVDAIADGSVNFENIMQKIALANCINDTADVDFYKIKHPPLQSLEILTPIFVDNIILFGITTEARINRKTKKCQDAGRYNSKIKELLVGNNINIGKVKATHYAPANDLTMEQKRNFLNNTLTSETLIDMKFYKQFYKVPLANLDIKTIYNIFNAENLDKFKQHGIYLNDIDFTADIKGCFDKKNLINFLIDKFGYKKEGRGANIDEYDRIILNNEKNVGSHCLTFLNKENGIIKRQKFYNKFIQSLESGSVRKLIGSHIAEWVNNPEERLEKTIPQSLESGLLRLEITYYINRFPDLEDVEEDIQNLQNILSQSPLSTFFYTPISEQYKEYTSIIKENLIILEPNLKTLLFCRSFNSKSEKINGIFKTNYSKEILKVLLGLLTFNKMTRVLIINADKRNTNDEQDNNSDDDDDEPEGEQKVRLKRSSILKIQCRTYKKQTVGRSINEVLLTDSGITSKIKHRIGEKINLPEERGLIPYNGITWKVPTAQTSYALTGISFVEINRNSPENFVAIESLKKQKKLKLQQEIDDNDLTVQDQIKTQQKEQYDNFVKQIELKEKIDKQLSNIGSSLKNSINFKNLNTLEKGEKLAILAFRNIRTKHRETHIIYTRSKSTGEYVCYWSVPALSSYLSKLLSDDSNNIQEHVLNFFYIHRFLQNIPIILIVEIKDFVITPTGHKQPNINIIANNKDLKAPTQNIDLNILDTTSDMIKSYKPTSLKQSVDDLDDNAEYVITGLCKHPYRSVFKYVINIKDKITGATGIYKSSYFIEQLLNDVDLTKTRTFILLKTDQMRLTPYKGKSKFCYLEMDDKMTVNMKKRLENADPFED